MAHAPANVTLYTCDAPECTFEHIAKNGELPTEGYFGIVKWSTGAGDFEDEWYAHTANHIRKAVVAVTERDNTNGDIPEASTAAGSSKA